VTLMHHRIDGPSAAPTVLLANSLGTTFHMWDEQIAPLTEHVQVLRYDHRGHGPSPAPPGPYSIAGLGGDVLELLDHLGLERVSVAGLSLGGMVGIWLAANHPERVDRLVLCATAPVLGPKDMWASRAALVRAGGTASLLPDLFERWFTPRSCSDRPDMIERFTEMLSAVDGEGYACCCEAIASMDQRNELSRITAPTMCIFGAADPVTPPEAGEVLRRQIAEAGLVVIPRAAHLANVEQPAAFTRAIIEHLVGDSLDRGLARRRAVLGDDYVDRALREASVFTAPFQDFITRYAWGEIWSRPGLPRETRQLLTIAMLAALGRQEELELHLRAAGAAGVSREAIREVLLQTAIYAGVPAANSAFAIAKRVLAETETAEAEGNGAAAGGSG
jgi:3-oxoadipate enol-lactonase/4-carboxymuconolactone decarboxylase